MRRPGLAVVGFALCAAACSHPRAPRDAPVAALAPRADDVVVATVDGRPIYAGAVAAQARARGVDARTALGDLVDAEALAGEAARRGLDRDLDVRLAAKGALVRRLLAQTFERDVTPADVPAPLVRQAYDRNRNLFDHDLYVDVWHILVPVNKGATPAERAQARARAEEIARRARGCGSLAAFQALAGDLRIEEVVTARDGWTEPAFSHAAFAQLHRPGDTTGVVETSYGYHVEYLVRFIPPEHRRLGEVEPALRARIFPEVQKKAFAQFVAEAMARHHVVVHPERLADLSP